MIERIRRSGGLKVAATFLTAILVGAGLGATKAGLERRQQAEELSVPLGYDSASVLGGCSITGARLYPDGHVQLTVRTPSDVPERMRRIVEGGDYPERTILLSANDKGKDLPAQPFPVLGQAPIFSNYGTTYPYDETYPGLHNIQVDITAAGVPLDQINPGKDLVYCGSVEAV
jgi:hypothetical protein